MLSAQFEYWPQPSMPASPDKGVFQELVGYSAPRMTRTTADALIIVAVPCFIMAMIWLAGQFIPDGGNDFARVLVFGALVAATFGAVALWVRVNPRHNQD